MSNDMRTSFAADIEAEAKGPILAVVIGDDERYFDDDGKREAALAHKGEVLAWDEARPLLDYPFDSGYGGVDCHAVTAWTADRVVFVTVYDGASWLASVPRNPAPEPPAFHGGG